VEEKIEQASSVDIESLYNQFLNWTQNEISVMDFGLQIGLLLFAVVLAMIASPRLDEWASRLEEQFQGYAVSRLFATIRDIAFPLSWLLIQWLAIVVPRLLEQEDKLLVVTTSLLTAWVFIRIVSTLITNPLIRRSVTTLAWIWATLTILGLAEDTRAVMSDIGFAMGGVKLTLMGVFEGVVTLVVLLWAASFAAQIFENAVNKFPNLTPSIQVLSSKLIRMALLAFAFFGPIAIVGIDLTALAVFSGAIGVGVGVGLGFGLQKTFGNPVGGIILLLEKSLNDYGLKVLIHSKIIFPVSLFAGSRWCSRYS
jgi:small-conductance mechanosensitive channel